MNIGNPSIDPQFTTVVDGKQRPNSCTACILRTQRLGYSPKNTRHLSSSMAKQQSPPVVHVTPFKCPTRSTIVCSCVLCWER